MTVYIALGVLIFVVTLCQGTIGFGLGTIATPIIAMVAPELVPAVILVLALCIASVTAWQHRAAIAWRIVALSSAARVPGSLLGAWAVAALSHRGLGIVIGCAVLLAMTLSGLGWTPKHNTPNTLAAGVASGFLGTSTSIGGPPMALILKDFDPARVRGTLSGTFVIGCIISLVTLGTAGQISQLQLTTALAYLPVAFAGLFVARRLNRFIDTVMLNRIVLVVAVTAAIALIAQSIIA